MAEKWAMSRELAEVFVYMECVCDGEGMGPDTSEALAWIADAYPDLRQRNPSLDWPTLPETSDV